MGRLRRVFRPFFDEVIGEDAMRVARTFRRILPLCLVLSSCGDENGEPARSVEEVRREWDAARMTDDGTLAVRAGEHLLREGALPAEERSELLQIAVRTGDPERVLAVSEGLVRRGTADDALVARAWLDLAHASALARRPEALVDALALRLREDQGLHASGLAAHVLQAHVELAFALGDVDAFRELLTRRGATEPGAIGSLFAQVAPLAHADHAALLADPRLSENPMTRAQWLATAGRYDEALTLLRQVIEEGHPERSLLARRLSFRVDVLRGEPIDMALARELGFSERVYAMRCRNEHDDALAILDAEGRLQSPEALVALREAGRFDEARAVLSRLAEAASPAVRARASSTERRIDLEEGREPRPLDETSPLPVEEALWAGIGFLLHGENARGRALIERAHAAFPSGGSEREAWAMAHYLLASGDAASRPVALDWTRVPRQHDNDQLFLSGVRHLLNAEPRQARESFEEARESTVGKEFPWHVTVRALERLDAREEGR